MRVFLFAAIVCFAVAVPVFVWLQRRPEDGQPRQPKKPVKPSGPKMAIPRGRVR